MALVCPDVAVALVDPQVPLLTGVAGAGHLDQLLAGAITRGGQAVSAVAVDDLGEPAVGGQQVPLLVVAAVPGPLQARSAFAVLPPETSSSRGTEHHGWVEGE